MQKAVKPSKEAKIGDKDKNVNSKNITNKQTKPKVEKNDKVTHLYLHDKYLTSIKNICPCKYLTVLYLHSNLITKIENLDAAVNLTSLYLQKNRITKIENLNALTKLRKLYLGHNEITVVENLDNLQNLEELHVEKQNISKWDSLCFDPRAVFALCNNLQTLNIASNNIVSINILSPFKYLKKLNASKNNLKNINDVCATIQTWHYLHEAWFTGNPISKTHRYREDIIGSTTRLALLDNKAINETTRCFIKRFEYEKIVRGSKQSINLADSFKCLPKNYPPPLQKAVSTYILKSKEFDTSLNEQITEKNEYIPWNSLPHTSTKRPTIMKNQRRKLTVKDKTQFSTIFPNMMN